MHLQPIARPIGALPHIPSHIVTPPAPIRPAPRDEPGGLTREQLRAIVIEQLG